MVHLIRIPHDRVPTIWPGVQHLIYRAIKRADLVRFEPVERMTLAGECQLWVAYDDRVRGAAITQIVQTENRQVLHIAAAGGNMEVGKALIGKIEEYGREQECVASRITGRCGWEKIFPMYRRRRVILEKAL